MAKRVYLAVDLGAESGRVMAGTLAGGTVSLEEIHRFPNGPVDVAGTHPGDLTDAGSSTGREDDHFAPTDVRVGRALHQRGGERSRGVST